MRRSTGLQSWSRSSRHTMASVICGSARTPESTIGPQFVPIPMPTVSTVDERASHHERLVLGEEPRGVGGVPAGVTEQTHPTEWPQAGRDPDA